MSFKHLVGDFTSVLSSWQNPFEGTDCAPMACSGLRIPGNLSYTLVIPAGRTPEAKLRSV